MFPVSYRRWFKSSRDLYKNFVALKKYFENLLNINIHWLWTYLKKEKKRERREEGGGKRKESKIRK